MNTTCWISLAGPRGIWQATQLSPLASLACLSGVAILRLVAGETLCSKVSRLLGRFRRCVGIVAGAAPHFVAACALAGALREVFHVAGHSQVGWRTGAYEYREIIGQKPAWCQSCAILPAFPLWTRALHRTNDTVRKCCHAPQARVSPDSPSSRALRCGRCPHRGTARTTTPFSRNGGIA